MRPVRHYFQLLLLVFLLSGCASYSHVPDGYAGSTATITDTARNISSAKGEIFYVRLIDGNEVKNAATSTRASSYNTGFRLTAVGFTRSVRPVEMKLTLVGRHVTAAPIHEFFSRATANFFTVEGDISFTPSAGKNYLVKGFLNEKEAAVWIEDQEGKEVTERIIAR